MTSLRLKCLPVAGQIVAAALLISAAAWPAWAADSSPERSRAYLLDQDGHVVKSGFGLCWRTGSWTPALAALDPAGCECDGEVLGDACAPRSAAGAAAPPSPAPAAAPRPAGEKITVAADILFDSGKADLRAEARQKLVEIAERAQGVKLEVVIVVGHVDRLEGKQPSLRRLGEQRADAVRKFLVAQGVEANRIYVESKGATQPLTGQKCNGLAAAKARACLQPDRHVEIEVVGTHNYKSAKPPKGDDRTSCRTACQQASDDCWSAGSARKTQCEKSGSTSRKVCDSKYQDDVSDCSFQRIQCASACE